MPKSIRTDLYANRHINPLLKPIGRKFIDLTAMDRAEFLTVITDPVHCL